MTWTLYGTTDPIVSTDNSQGNAEEWTPIASGSTGLPPDRNRLGPVISFENSVAYDAYKLILNSVREGDIAPANSVQVGEVQFYGTIRGCSIPFADIDGDGDVDQVDFGAYQACLTGQGNPNTIYECGCFDHDKEDGDIDTVRFRGVREVRHRPGDPLEPGADAGLFTVMAPSLSMDDTLVAWFKPPTGRGPSKCAPSTAPPLALSSNDRTPPRLHDPCISV